MTDEVDRLEVAAAAGRRSATTPDDCRGRHRATIDGSLDLREAPETAREGPGLYVGPVRLGRDGVDTLVEELIIWLRENGR